MSCVGCVSVTFVYCVETAKDTAIVAMMIIFIHQYMVDDIKQTLTIDTKN